VHKRRRTVLGVLTAAIGDDKETRNNILPAGSVGFVFICAQWVASCARCVVTARVVMRVTRCIEGRVEVWPGEARGER
jgi:hypothetical protein